MEAFYKGLEDLENELDPKQIEKLIIFLEVIRTQEKFSKVLSVEFSNFNDIWCSISTDSSQIVQFISNSQSLSLQSAQTPKIHCRHTSQPGTWCFVLQGWGSSSIFERKSHLWRSWRLLLIIIYLRTQREEPFRDRDKDIRLIWILNIWGDMSNVNIKICTSLRSKEREIAQQ